MSSDCLNTVAIKIHIHTPSGYINTIPRNINPHAQWLSQYVRPVAISIYTPSGNIKNSPENINLYAQCLSQYSVPISLTYMISDNLNACTMINIYKYAR